MLLLLMSAVFLYTGEAVPPPCKLDASVVEAVTNSHNKLRANVAKRNLNTAIFGDLPGSKTLFKLVNNTLIIHQNRVDSLQKYDCVHERLAQATIGNKCKHSSNYKDKAGRAENFIRYRLAKEPDVNKQKDLFEFAVEDWMNTVEKPLSANAVYTDTSMEPFANMIYNKTLEFGCWFRFCKETRKVAVACVYDNKPRKGKPLYWADSKNHVGCQKAEPCKKIIKGTDVNCDTTYGLCDQDFVITPALQEPADEDDYPDDGVAHIMEVY